MFEERNNFFNAICSKISITFHEKGKLVKAKGRDEITYTNTLRFRMSSEKVAENIKFCLFLGRNALIFLMSLIKPISNMRSASSKTNTSR